MAAEDNYKRLRAELDERLKADKRLRAIGEKIKNGKADFRDTAEYSQLVAHHLGEVISENIGSITNPLGKEMVCKALLRDQYEDINGVMGEVQASVDEQMGIHLNPVKAPFPAERVDKAAHSLEDPTVSPDTIKRRARSTTENITVSMHDDYIKENADYRTAAGLTAYIERTTDGSCCPWCSKVAGRYVYGPELSDDVFKRHDNCTCMVDYVCEKGRQDVWSKKWREPAGKAERIEYAESQPKPTKNTPEQAKELENQFMLASKPGKDDSAIADMNFINSREFANKFKGKYENVDVENAVVKACRQLVKNRNGTFYEEAFFIDAKTGKTVSYVKGKQKNGVNMPENLKKHLTNAPEKSIIMIHNHPNSSPFSTADFLTAAGYSSCYEAIACGHSGVVYSFRNAYQKQGAFLGYIEEDGKKIPYYEGTRDYYIAFAKHRRTNDDFNARHLAWENTASSRGFEYERR